MSRIDKILFNYPYTVTSAHPDPAFPVDSFLLLTLSGLNLPSVSKVIFFCKLITLIQ